MGYTRNFGIRAHANIVREGRLKTAAASSHEIGAPVMVDSANPGQMKAATAGAATGPGAGVVVFEHIQMKGVDTALSVSDDFHTVPAASYAQMVHGNGVKVVLKATAAKTLYDGRVIAAYNPFAGSVNLTTLAVGAQLTPDGAGKWKVANGTTDGNWLTVQSVSATSATVGVVEASFNF